MSKQTEIWERHPQPFCVSTFSKVEQRSRPLGNKRYATSQEALAVATRLDPNLKRFLCVDYYEAIAKAHRA